MKEGWKVKKLGEVCEIYQPKTISTNALVENGKYLVYGANGVIGKYDQYNHTESELLMTCRGATCGTINISEPYSWINGNAMVIHPVEGNITMSYLKYVLRGIDLSNVITGAAQPQITRQSLSPLLIPIPPLPEQFRIVEELDLLSNIIEKKRQQLSELDNFAQSIFYDMFGDPVTNEKGWEVKKYREFGKVIGGYAFVSDLFTDDGIPVLKIGNINSGNLKVDKLCFYKYDENLLNYLVYPNDIVISLTGTVGKNDYGNVCVLPDLYNVYYLNQRNAKLDTKGVCENLFLKFLFADYKIKAELTKNSRGVRQANISNNDIYNLSLPLPPLSLQQFFARKIEAIEKQKAFIKQSIAETEELFNSRMDYYFS